MICPTLFSELRLRVRGNMALNTVVTVLTCGNGEQARTGKDRCEVLA
jgi:hypothetical protein